MFLGTQLDNMHDALGKGRVSRGAEHGAATAAAAKRGEQHYSFHSPHLVPRGADKGTAKLEQPDVEEIIRLCAQRVPQKTIGAVYGISQQHVSRLWRGEEWAHLDRAKLLGAA